MKVVNGNANFLPVFFYLCFIYAFGTKSLVLELSSLALMFIQLNSTTCKCCI